MVLFYCAVILILIIWIIKTAKIEMSIYNFNINNESNTKNNEKLNIEIALKVYGIKILKIKFDKKKLEKIYAKISISKIKKNNKKHISKIVKKKIKKEIKKVDLKIEMLDLNIDLGTSDVLITTFTVSALSIIISNVLPYIIDTHKNIKNYKYKIMPIYKQNILYKLNLNCIINANLVHIINIIFLIRKGRSDKNERTSNRKSYDYSYE